MKCQIQSRLARVLRRKQFYFLGCFLLLLVVSALYTTRSVEHGGRNRRYASQFVEVGGSYEAVLHRLLHRLKGHLFDLEHAKMYTASNITSMMSVPLLPGLKNPCFIATEHIEYVEEDKNKRGSRISVRCVPYFLFAGFQKCGTSDIYDRLRVHPDITDSSFYKEPHFWKRELSFSNYTALFQNGPTEMMTRAGGIVELLKKVVKHIKNEHYTPDVTPPKGSYNSLIQGDFSATNAILPVDRIKSLFHVFPYTKVIMLLRDPSDRAFSHYIMDVRYGYVKGKLDQAGFHKVIKKIITCLNSKKKIDVYKTNCPGDWILTAGMYVEFLQNWLQIFPSDNLLLLQFEEYIKHTAPVLQEQVIPFLGLNSLNNEELDNIRNLPVNNPTHADFDMYSATRIMLDDFYEPYNRRLVELLDDEKFGWP